MKSLKLIPLKALFCLSAVLQLTQSAHATDASITIPASVTVDATITLNVGTAMNFGQFYMTGITTAENGGAGPGGGAINGARTQNASSYIELLVNGNLVSSDGTTSKASSVIGPGVNGTFTIAGAAVSTPVRFTSPELIDGDSTAGTQPFNGPTGDSITFTDLTIDTDGDGIADNDLAATGDGAVVNGTTDATGALTVSTGGRLYSTYIGGVDNNLYEVGAFSGTYTITVSY